jgi:phage terminase large subunit-like protein
MLIAWVLAFSRRRRRGVWVAADKQQGCEGLDAIGTLCRHNKWLDDILVVRGDRVENKHTGSVMYFTTSDVLSAFGWKDCDLFVMDEVTHWGPKGQELWAAMYSAAGKRKNAVVFALMNAGMFDTWQRELRDKAEVDPKWAFSELPDAIASWISEEQLADQARYLPRVAFSRLWRNWWSTGGGDALTPEQIDAAFDAGMCPMSGRAPGWLFVAGVDLGLTRDFASVLTLAYPNRQSQQQFRRIQMADAKLWRPPKDGKIDLMAIEAYILALDDRFHLDHVALDPWQAELLGQRLEADTRHARRQNQYRKRYEPWVQMVPPTGKNLREQASLVIESFTDGSLCLYPYPPLKSDLLRLRVEEKSYGFRLVSPKDAATGHGDSFSAFANALLVGHAAASKTRFLPDRLDRRRRG